MYRFPWHARRDSKPQPSDPQDGETGWKPLRHKDLKTLDALVFLLGRESRVVTSSADAQKERA